LKIEYIIIHHSWSKDNPASNDWDGICKYHQSYRYQGNIITKEQAEKLIAQKIKGVDTPWRPPCGYHYGLEQVDNKPEQISGGWVIQKGRPEEMAGAHCLEQGINFKSLGICVIGNYDNQPPAEEAMNLLAFLCTDICKRHGLTAAKIYPHNLFATYKSCPGKSFPMPLLQKLVNDKLALGGI
jgi:hypothetical protein